MFFKENPNIRISLNPATAIAINKLTDKTSSIENALFVVESFIILIAASKIL